MRVFPADKLADTCTRVVRSKGVPDFLQADLYLFLNSTLVLSFDGDIQIGQLYFIIRLLI